MDHRKRRKGFAGLSDCFRLAATNEAAKSFVLDGGKWKRLFEWELRKEKAEGRISRLQPTLHLPPASAGGAVECRDKQPASAGLVIGLQTEWPATCQFTSCSEC